MAKDSGLLLLVGGAAVAWYGYTQGWFSSLFGTAVPAVIPAPMNTQGTNPPMQTSPATVTTPAAPSASSLSASGSLAALALAAQASSEGLPNAPTATLNADQWNYYYGHVPKFQPSVNGAAVNPGSLFDLDSIFFPNGRPANNAAYTQYTAAQFIAALQNAGVSWTGLSGFGQVGYARRIPVPTMVRPAYGRYTMADLRRAGGR